MMEIEMAVVSVLQSEVYEDGGYATLVKVFGREFSIQYIKSEIRIRGFASQYESIRNWKYQGAVKAAQEFAEWHIGLQPAEWHAAHAALYAEGTE
jgi:hypothetical protein